MIEKSDTMGGTEIIVLVIFFIHGKMFVSLKIDIPIIKWFYHIQGLNKGGFFKLITRPLYSNNLKYIKIVLEGIIYNYLVN